MPKPHHAPTDPIVQLAHLQQIKHTLIDHPRNFALFTLGTNTAFRGGDILSLDIGDVRDLKVGDILTLKEQKTSKRRSVTVNAAVHSALGRLLETVEDLPDDTPLFRGQGLRTRMTIETFGRLVKKWCKDAGLTGNFASHTLRKTWAFQNRKRGADILVIQKALGHSSPAVTMAYMCVQSQEMSDLYMQEI